MPEHLAIDANVLSGTAHLESAKTVEVEFRNSEGDLISFTLAPRIQLTVTAQLQLVPYKVKNNKTGTLYTGFTIGFSQNVTTDVEWQASVRA